MDGEHHNKDLIKDADMKQVIGVAVAIALLAGCAGTRNLSPE